MTGTTEGGRKTAEGGRGNPEKASPSAIEKYIKGINFPADKTQLIDHARSNNAPSDVINVLEKFEDKEYDSPIDLAKEVGRME